MNICNLPHKNNCVCNKMPPKVSKYRYNHIIMENDLNENDRILSVPYCMIRNDHYGAFPFIWRYGLLKLVRCSISIIEYDLALLDSLNLHVFILKSNLQPIPKMSSTLLKDVAYFSTIHVLLSSMEPNQ